MLGIIAKKLGMTQMFKEDGVLLPITAVQAGPCVVLQKKTEDKDGYCSIQLGFDEKRPKSTTKPLTEHFKKANTTPKKAVFEFRVKKEELDAYQIGQTITFEGLFKAGDFIDVVGTSKGKGFTGVMKRHGFHGSDAGHGTHEYFRHGGSIGQHTYPGRTFKGLKMPGHHGDSRVTLQNLKIAQVNKDLNLIFIIGAIPGAKSGYVLLNKAVKKKQK
jgi:large subunit ribosomal protein L3